MNENPALTGLPATLAGGPSRARTSDDSPHAAHRWKADWPDDLESKDVQPHGELAFAQHAPIEASRPAVADPAQPWAGSVDDAWLELSAPTTMEFARSSPGPDLAFRSEGDAAEPPDMTVEKPGRSHPGRGSEGEATHADAAMGPDAGPGTRGESVAVPVATPQAAPNAGGSPEASALNAPQTAGDAAGHRAAPLPPSGAVASEPQVAQPGAAGPLPPASQLGPALAALHSTPDGARHVTIRLDPAELGQVQVRITRAQDGPASITVTVERPETLRSLQADLSHLHQSLDRAGVPENRSLALQLGMPDAGFGDSGAGSQSGFHANSQQHETRTRSTATTGSDLTGELAKHLPAAAQRWYRAGINITA